MSQSRSVNTPTFRRGALAAFAAVLSLLVIACEPFTTTPEEPGGTGDPGGSGDPGGGDPGGGDPGGGGGGGGDPVGGGWEDPDDGSGLRAFPGAEGFGTDTPGGRGGKVYVVTTLNWSGPGSFHEAITATEPRIIVFRVAGIINVPGDGAFLSEANSYVTVAGQTSPGGITLGGTPGVFLNNYHNNFHDAIFRFIRFRGHVGNGDGISFNECHHVVFDHCDFSGGGDEIFDVTFSHHVTLQWSTVTNSFIGGKGSLIAYSPTAGISMHHNFYAHHSDRFFPHMHWGSGGVPAGGAIIEFSNNVGYNQAFEAAMYVTGPLDSSQLAFNVVGNYVKAGPNTAGSSYAFALATGSSVYETDNQFPGHDLFSIFRVLNLLTGRAPAPPITYTPSANVFDLVLDKVGAFPRDPMNERTVAEARNGTGQLGKTDDPYLSVSWAVPQDTDLDGMPNDWETERGLNPNDKADAALDRNGDGYTNIEEYINGVAAFLIPD